ncbi:MAG: O-antigen ligase family protein, partial [Actinomycetota bacterium]|nr:O-antigen ligase family protein [Actinomycetota bacterium]
SQSAYFLRNGWTSFDPVLPRFQAKEVIYLGGAYALAAGVPVLAYVRSTGVLRRLLVPAGALATFVFLATMAGQRFSISIPGLKGATLGNPGADTASAFVVLAMLAVAVGSVRVDRRPLLIAFGIPLTLSVALAEQRAAFIGIAASYGLLLAVLFSSNAKRRLISRPTEGFLAFLAIAALLLTATLGPVILRQRKDLVLPFHKRIESTFGGKGKSESAADRRLIWQSAIKAIKEKPAFGWGLGRTVRAYRTGFFDFALYPDMHNIYLDLLLRRGFVGLALFLIAVGLSLRDGWRVWRFHPDSRVGAMAIGAIAGIVGLLGKGLVESIFEKYRLAILLGLLLGMLRTARTSLTKDEWSRHPERLPEPVSLER